MSAKPIGSQVTSAAQRDNKQLQVIFFSALAGSVLLIIVVICGAFAWIALSSNSSIELPTLLGVSGDFLSGLLAPLLSLVSIYFVVVTLREQRQTTLDERRAEAIEGFENRFYRLIDLHRANVDEMSLQTSSEEAQAIKGKRVFLAILSELRIAMKAVREHFDKGDVQLSVLQELQIAYYFVFFGIGNDSILPLFQALRADGSPISTPDLVVIEGDLASLRTVDDPYKKFDGHQVRLGHYYRHLFQAVSFVHNQSVVSDKESYIKTLRAQLSTYEQMLLLINSLTPVGWRWLNEGFIQKYGLVKNIPALMLERHCGLSVVAFFSPDYWEYEEPVCQPKGLHQISRIELTDPPKDSKF